MAAPGAHFAPAVEHGHGLHAVRRGALDVLIELAELVAHALHIVKEFREIARELEVAAVADAVNRAAQDRAAGSHPVDLRLPDRVAMLVERIREEIRQQPALGVLHALDIGDQAERGAVAHAAYDRIQTDGLEFIHERLGTDPVIAQEHHRFLAHLVGDVNHLPGERSDLAALERLEIPVLPARHAVLVVEVALINDVLRAEPVPHLALKLLEDIRGHRGGIAVPVHILFTLERVKHQRELVEERGIADHIHIRMLRDEPAQALHRVFAGLGLAYIERDLMLDVLPVVDHGVVHMHRVPDQIAQERHSVLVIRGRLVDDDKAVLIAPAVRGDDLARRAVDDLPPALDVVAGVGHEQLGGEVVHQLNLQRALLGHAEAGHDVALLHLIRVRLRPGVVLAGGVVGGVNLRIHSLELGREVRAIAVADRVRAPAGKQFKRLRDDVKVGRDRHASTAFCFIAHSSILQYIDMIIELYHGCESVSIAAGSSREKRLHAPEISGIMKRFL